MREKNLKGDSFRDVDLMLFDKVIVFDHYRQKLLLIAGVDPQDAKSSYEKAAKELEELERLLNSGARADFKPLRLEDELKPVYSKERFQEMVKGAKYYIREGDISRWYSLTHYGQRPRGAFLILTGC